MNKQYILGSLAMISALALASTDADAADTKLYPGNGCRTASGGTISYFAGTVGNQSSTSELTVACPLVRDASSISSATIEVFDRNQNVDLSCTLFSESSSGSSVFSDSETQSSGAGFFGSTVKTLNFSALDPGDYYYATCSIPRSTTTGFSHVIRMRIVEAG